MKSEQEQPLSTEPSSNKADAKVDRRRFMESAAVIGAALSVDGSIWGQAAAAQLGGAPADSRMPDGTEFISWEKGCNAFPIRK